MRKLLLSTLLIFLSVSLVACKSESDGKLKVGLIQYAQHPALDQANEGFIKAIEDEGYIDKVSIDIQNAQGEQATAETIADKLVNDRNDLIYAIGTPAAMAVAQKTTDIPTIISAVTNPADSKLVDSNEKPGGNITGVSDLTPVEKQIQLLDKIAPKAKNVAVMYTNAERNSEYQFEVAKKALEAKGLNVVKATVTESNQVQQVTESLIGKVDVIYVPTDNLVSENITNVTAIANENKIITIVGEVAMVEGGALITEGINYFDLGYLAGQQALKVLKGEAKPADMPIEYLSDDKLELALNESTAQKLGITLPKDILDKAKKIK